MASTKPATQETNFEICARKSPKISYKTSHRKTYFTEFCELVYSLLSQIVKSYVLPTNDICGTNDLKKDDNANEVNNSTLEVALSYSSSNNNVLVSGIKPHSDKVTTKAIEASKHLENECCKRNTCYFSNSNISPKYDCNKSGLHNFGKEEERVNLLKLFYLLWTSLTTDIKHQ